MSSKVASVSGGDGIIIGRRPECLSLEDWHYVRYGTRLDGRGKYGRGKRGGASCGYRTKIKNEAQNLLKDSGTPRPVIRVPRPPVDFQLNTIPDFPTSEDTKPYFFPASAHLLSEARLSSCDGSITDVTTSLTPRLLHTSPLDSLSFLPSTCCFNTNLFE